jgi:hypothetical protein
MRNSYELLHVRSVNVLPVMLINILVKARDVSDMAVPEKAKR